MVSFLAVLRAEITSSDSIWLAYLQSLGVALRYGHTNTKAMFLILAGREQVQIV